MKTRPLIALAALVAAVGLPGGAWWHLRGGEREDIPGARPATAALGPAARAAGGSASSAGPAVPVTGARVRNDTFVVWVKAEGEAAALRSAPLRAEVAGVVTEVAVREGDGVAKGQLIARIDTVDPLLELRKRDAEYRRARSEYRALMLGAEGPELTGEERRDRRRQARVRSGLARAEVELEEARLRLDRTRVRAPFAGRTANLTIGEGARLERGDSIATVLDLSRVEVDVDVLQTRVPHVAPGRPARVRFTALPGETFAGRVASINPLVHGRSEAVRATVRLDHGDRRIFPGMHARVEIAGRRYANRTFVPREAIVERDRRQLVFTVAPTPAAGDTGRAEWTYVTTGLENDRFVELLPSEARPAPPAGTVVLVDGHTTLIHGARVRVTNGSDLAGPSRR